MQILDEMTDLREAKEQGLTYYDSARPCRNGHIGKRTVLNHQCATCKDENYKRWSSGDKGREYRIKDRLRYRNQPAARILTRLKTRAGRKGLAFDLDLTDIVIPNFCPVLGIPISISDTDRLDCSPSVDRFDNSLGYVKGNIRFVSWRANKIKSDATVQELEAVTNYARSGVGRFDSSTGDAI